MKKVIKPAEKEESVFYSDFSGKCFGEMPSPIELKIDFGYGSKYDGSNLSLDLDDTEITQILEFIKQKLCTETKEIWKKQLAKLENNLHDNVQFRDWSSCEYYSKNVDLLQFLLDIKED
jgi:hypothetical protein